MQDSERLSPRQREVAALVAAGLAVLSVGTAVAVGAVPSRRGDDVPAMEQASPAVAAGGGLRLASFQAYTTVSWATSDQSVGALTAASDLVIHGKVVALEAVTVQGSVKDRTFRSIESEYSVEVLAVGKGSVAPGDRLVVIQPGGASQDVVRIVEGDPPLSPGQEYLFFLTKDAQRDGYWMQGGPIGRMVVSGANASSLSQVDARAQSVPDLRIQSRSVADIRSEAKDHAADPRPVIEP